MPNDNAGSKSVDVYEKIDHIDLEQIQRARLVAAYHSSSADELEESLNMLGINKAWPDGWMGPVTIYELNRVK